MWVSMAGHSLFLVEKELKNGRICWKSSAFILSNLEGQLPSASSWLAPVSPTDASASANAQAPA